MAAGDAGETRDDVHCVAAGALRQKLIRRSRRHQVTAVCLFVDGKFWNRINLCSFVPVAMKFFCCKLCVKFLLKRSHCLWNKQLKKTVQHA